MIKWTLNITLPTKDFNSWEKKELTIYQTQISSENDEVYFELTIPKHIFDKVKDTEEKYSTKHSKFSNRLKSITYHGLISELKAISIDAYEKTKIQEEPKEKVICVKFEYDYKESRDSFNHGYTGNIVTNRYKWFIAYKENARIESLSNNKYWTNQKLKSDNSNNSFIEETTESDMVLLHVPNHGHLFEEQHIIIKWTKEREEFFENIENRYNELSKKLNDYINFIDENVIENIITETKQLLQIN